MGLVQQQIDLPRLAKAIACWLAIALPSTCSGVQLASTGEIKGIVTTVDGDSVAGALVMIVSASAQSTQRATTSYCAPGCGKHAVTGADGRFAIRRVARDSAYTLYVEAEDCFPRVVSASPSTDALQVELATAQSVPDQSGCQAAGQILQRDGTPAAGALISRLVPVTVTNRDGKFFIVDGRPLRGVPVVVDFEHAVKDQVFHLNPGAGNTFTLLKGATVSGRVVSNAEPIAGVEVGLAPPTANVDAIEATSDRDGRFTFEHVPPNRSFWLFTKMRCLAARNLAATRTKIRSGKGGLLTEFADVELHTGHRVRGRLIFSDSPAFTSEICVVLYRVDVPDSQVVYPDDNREFVFEGVPSESVVLSFHTTGMRTVHNYRLSPQHDNLDELRPTALCGRVDEDVDLSVLFEPGMSRLPSQPWIAATKTANRVAANETIMIKRMILHEGRAMGQKVRASALNERQRRLEAQPLRGGSVDVLSKLPESKD